MGNVPLSLPLHKMKNLWWILLSSILSPLMFIFTPIKLMIIETYDSSAPFPKCHCEWGNSYHQLHALIFLLFFHPFLPISHLPLHLQVWCADFKAHINLNYERFIFNHNEDNRCYCFCSNVTEILISNNISNYTINQRPKKKNLKTFSFFVYPVWFVIKKKTIKNYFWPSCWSCIFSLGKISMIFLWNKLGM